MNLNNRIFYNDLPHWDSGQNVGKIKWIGLNNYPLRFSYNGYIDFCYISYIKDNNKRKIVISYCGNVLTRNSNSFNKITPEDILGIKKSKEYTEFKYEINDRIQKDDLDISVIGRYRENDISKTKRYLFRCNKCEFDSSVVAYRYGKEIHYSITEYNLDNLIKCPCCHGRIVQTGINDVQTVSPDIVKFFNNKEESKIFSIKSSHKITCVCPDCGSIKKNKITINQLHKLKHISCVCGNTISFPERIMYNILNTSKAINGNFTYQYSPEWCVFECNDNKMRGVYDFYYSYNNKKYLVEMDGAFHFEKYYKSQKVPQNIIDENKNKLAKANNYQIIRIDCRKSEFEYIRDNIISTMENNIVNDIDWNKIEKLSLSNLIKTICIDYELNKSKQNIMTYLEDKYHFSRGNIIANLHKGTKYGWCNYNSKPQWKKVYQFDMNGKLLNTYQSCNQAIRESGISSLNLILLGKINQRPPFIWSYNKEIGSDLIDRIGNPC